MKKTLHIVLMGCFLLGCSHAAKNAAFTLHQDFPIRVDARVAWTKVDVNFSPGDCLDIRAQGEIEIDKRWRGTLVVYDPHVGPKGTYSLRDEDLMEKYPMPSAGRGPHPAFSLIAKIGEAGQPFYVGDHLRLDQDVAAAAQAGELFLGINDFNLSDNAGAFYARVEKCAALNEPPAPEAPSVTAGEVAKHPRFFLIYIDGLRPDVLYEMAANGFLPNLKEHLFDRGIFYKNAFTIFPSNTITTNSAWMTGLFTDKTGVKSQTEFDRKDKKVQNFLDKFSPTLVANRLRPVDEFRVGRYMAMGFYWATFQFDKARQKRAELNAGVDAFYDYAKKNKLVLRTTTLPILDPHPPHHFLETFSNKVDWPISAIEGVRAFDAANAEYLYRYLLDHDTQILLSWFPGVDIGSHFSARGQFGSARKYLYEFDREFGRIVAKMKRRKMYDDCYFILYSDHGHSGGKDYVNQRFNLPFEAFFLPPRDDNQDGVIDVGSGLGLNIKLMEYDRRHSSEDAKDFVAFDVGAYGFGGAFLPFANYTSKNWSQRNSFYELTHYAVSKTFPEVNILEHVLNVRSRNANLYPESVSDHPIAAVLVPVTGRIAPKESTLAQDDIVRVYLKSSKGSEALIEAKIENDAWLYRYRPVKNFSVSQQGEMTFEEKSVAHDPLGYFDTLRPDLAGFPKGSKKDFMMGWHDGRTWLKATVYAEFPNGPEFYTKYFDWDALRENYRDRKTPDFVFLANTGWTLRWEDVLSTDHGYAQHESMNIPLLFAGSGLKQGVVSEEPVYIIDILPTVLKTLGVPYDEKWVDGRPLASAFVDGPAPSEFAVKPLGMERMAAQGHYHFLGADLPDRIDTFKEQLPPEPPDTFFHTHNLSRYTDLHNIVADVLVFSSFEIIHGIDQLFDVIVPGPNIKPINWVTEKWLSYWDTVPNSWLKRRSSDFVNALYLREISFGDAYSISSLALGQSFTPVPVNPSFIWRYLDMTQWVEDMLMDGSHAVSKPFGKEDILGVRYINGTLDVVRYPVWLGVRLVMKYGVEWADRALLRVERGVDFFVNLGRDRKPILLEGYPDHLGCDCSLYLKDMETIKSKAGQGGDKMKVPAPAKVY